MTQTIEEAARAYQRESNVMMSNFCPEDIEDAFINGAEHVMSLPLASRLTPAEKERVRKEYAETYPDDIDRGVTNMCIESVLERIFGTELFKEG